jgi:hypothetical protein
VEVLSAPKISRPQAEKSALAREALFFVGFLKNSLERKNGLEDPLQPACRNEKKRVIS